MWPEEDSPTLKDVSAAAALLVPFALLIATLQIGWAFSEEQLGHSDPLMQSIAGVGGPWLVVAFVVAACALWVWRVRPDRACLKRACLWGLAGAGGAVLVAGGLRLAVGPEMPTFIPPEESAKPGFVLGLSAGVLEEVVFRLAVLPGLYALARRWLPRLPSVVVAALLTGLLFALCHELGPGAGTFQAGHFVTRVVLPGAVMSAVFFAVRPAFIIVAHSTAHLAIPVLFT